MRLLAPTFCSRVNHTDTHTTNAHHKRTPQEGMGLKTEPREGRGEGEGGDERDVKETKEKEREILG